MTPPDTLQIVSKTFRVRSRIVISAARTDRAQRKAIMTIKTTTRRIRVTGTTTPAYVRGIHRSVYEARFAPKAPVLVLTFPELPSIKAA